MCNKTIQSLVDNLEESLSEVDCRPTDDLKDAAVKEAVAESLVRIIDALATVQKTNNKRTQMKSITQKTIPPTCWVRVKNRPEAGCWLVTTVLETGICFAIAPGDPSQRIPGRTWDNLRDMEYSTNLKRWKPCSK